MARKVSVSFAGSSASDLEDIRAYYTEQDVPDVGERLISEIISKIEKLSEYPDIGRVVPEFDLEYLRELIHPPFRIVYRRDSNKVRIVRIWRSERLFKIPEAS